jgi:hypothetical protein
MYNINSEIEQQIARSLASSVQTIPSERLKQQIANPIARLRRRLLAESPPREADTIDGRNAQKVSIY